MCGNSMLHTAPAQVPTMGDAAAAFIVGTVVLGLTGQATSAEMLGSSMLPPQQAPTVGDVQTAAGCTVVYTLPVWL